MKKLIKHWAAPVMCGLFIFLLFRFVLFIGYVPTASMEPTIQTESMIIGYRVFRVCSKTNKALRSKQKSPKNDILSARKTAMRQKKPCTGGDKNV